MLIDWFTVGAQVLNFVILVWLLKRFLYKPILNAIDAREKRIAAELAAADAKRAEAQKEKDLFESKNKTFDDQRAALMGKATDEAKVEGERLLSQARKEADALRTAQENALKSESAKMGGELTRLASAEVFEITRKALADLATASLEERMGEVFTRHLREMDPKAKGIMAGALRTSSEPAIVRSTFNLGPAQRAAIQNALNEDFSAEVRVRFETGPAGICGIEMTANGQRISWSIAEYLSSLERKVSALLDVQSVPVDMTPMPGPVAAPELRSVA